MNKRKSKAKTISDHNIKQRKLNSKSEQLEKAISYCQANNCTGRRAIKAGICPDIKDARTINRRLNGEIELGKEKEYCQILTCDEEDILSDFIKNKSQALQSVRNKDCRDFVLDLLKFRDDLNKRTQGGKKLSLNAKKALETNKIGKDFWKRFEAKFSLLFNKKQKQKSVTSLKRISSCTKEMAMQHLDWLADELMKAGIFKNPVRIEPGVWDGQIDTSRVFNHLETYHFFRSREDSEIFYCQRGKESEEYLSEGLDCVTVNPFVSLDGSVVLCHVIFKSKETSFNIKTEKITSETIPHLLISTSESGAQDERSLLEAYTFLENVIDSQKKPLLIFTDSQSNRLHHEVLQFCRNKKIRQFLGPPDSSRVTQLLDQLEPSSLHDLCLDEGKILNENGSIERQSFIDVLSNAWSFWINKETIIDAAKKVGISSNGLNWQWMQEEKFSEGESTDADNLWQDDAPTMTDVHSESNDYNNQSSYQECRQANDDLAQVENDLISKDY